MKRADAVKQAIQSMEMEGFIFNQDDKEIFKKLADGKIDHEEVRHVAASKIANWKTKNPEAFAKGF